MSLWERFGEREWALLGDAPLAAGAAVALASEGGGEREADAMVLGWRAAAAELGASPLIGELAARMDPEARERQGGPSDYGPPPSYAELLDEALGLCERAVALVGLAGSPADQEAYRSFVLGICERVAAAANERGLFGALTSAVSRNEQHALQLIARALGHGRPAPAPDEPAADDAARG